MAYESIGRMGTSLKDFFAKESLATAGGMTVGWIGASYATGIMKDYVKPGTKEMELAMGGVVKVLVGALLWSVSGMIKGHPLASMFVKFMGIGSMASVLYDVVAYLYPPIVTTEARHLLAITGSRHEPGTRGPQIPQPGPTRQLAQTPKRNVIVRGKAPAQAPVAAQASESHTDWTDDELRQHNFLTSK